MDLKDLSDAEFMKKYKGKTKSQIRALLNVNEGKMNQLSMDLEELSDTEFMKKYKGKTKSQIRALLKVNEK
jgi:uncharacterized protein (DUF433 family)